MLAAIIPWQQLALLCFVRASLYQGNVLIRNGGKDAEQVGLAAQAGCSQGLSHQPSQPLAGALGVFGEGFGDQSEIPALFNRQHLLCFFPTPLFFCKGCASWELFPCSALFDAWGPRDVPAWCAQLPFLRAEGWRGPLAQTKCPQSKPAGLHGWEPPLGNTNYTRSFPSKSHRRDLCPSWIPCSRSRGMWEALQTPVLQCAPVWLCLHSDIPRIAFIRVFGELIKFPVWQGALSCAR